MNIGIIGSGNMGGSLAKLWAEKGHNILITSTSPEQTALVAKSIGKNVITGSTADAVSYGDAVVFAFPFESLNDVSNIYLIYTGFYLHTEDFKHERLPNVLYLKDLDYL